MDPAISTLIGALVGGGAAISGQVYAARGQRQVQALQLREERIEDVRSVLDGASLALMKGFENYDWIVGQWKPGTRISPQSAPAGELWEVRRYEFRLAVRLAESEVFHAYRNAREALFKVFSSEAATDAAAQHELFAEHRDEAVKAQERFHRYATELLGVSQK